MPALNQTEARLPAIFPSSTGGAGSPDYFNIQNANLLGFHHMDGSYCLVSYLPQTVKTLATFGHFHNHYVVFINDTPGQVYDYAWSINYSFKDGSSVVSFSESDPAEQLALYEVRALQKGLAKDKVEQVSSVEVQCVISQGGQARATLSLIHQITPVDDDMAELIEGKGNSAAQAGNVPTTSLVANLIRDYYTLKPTWYEAHLHHPPHDPPEVPQVDFGDDLINTAANLPTENTPPLNYPTALLYARLLKSGHQSGKRNYFPKFNETYYENINNNTLTLEKQTRQNLVGPLAIAPHLAALCLGRLFFNTGGSNTDFVHIGDNNGTTIKEEDIFDAFKQLSEESKVDLYNFARFPKSSFVLSARMLATLLDKAKAKSHAHFKGSDNKKTTWTGDVAGSVDEDDYAKNVYFEYFNGPQAEIGTFEMFFRDCKLKKAVGKVHGHDYAPYVQKILERGFFTGTAKIKTAFFARRVIAIAADGQQSVSFEKINESVLGRQEYIVVETENLAGRVIKCNVKTADTQLTGTTGETLTLIQNSTGTADLVATVGDDSALKDASDQLFANAANFSQYAFVKMAFRSDQEATFNTWNNNIPADGTSNPRLTLEVGLDNPPAELGLQFGASTLVKLPTATAPFLDIAADHFTIGHLNKANVPRVVDAYFAKKVVTNPGGGAPVTVSFERIAEAPPVVNPATSPAHTGSYILGREVYIYIKTQKLTNHDLKFALRSADQHLTGTNNEYLPVPPINSMGGIDQQASHFTGRAITPDPANPANWLHDEAITDLNGNMPYANIEAPVVPIAGMQYHKDAIIKRIRLAPQDQIVAGVRQADTARTVFDNWAQNINNSPTNNAAVQLEIAPTATDNTGNPVYIYFGAERFDEEAIYAAHTTFHSEAGQTFTVENRISYEIYNGGNVFNLLGNRPAVADRFRMAKINNDFAHGAGHTAADPRHLITYFYFDANDNTHEICSVTQIQVIQKLKQDVVPAVPARGAFLGTQSFIPNQNAGEIINANTLIFYTNGTLGEGADGDIWYVNQGRNVPMIDMDILAQPGMGAILFQALNYDSGTGIIIRYSFMHSRRRHINPDRFAGFLGAIAQFREEGNLHEIAGEGFAYADGSGYPSVEHVNGEAGDLYYLRTDLAAIPRPLLQDADFDFNNQQTLCNLLFAFGYGRTERLLSENFSNPAIPVVDVLLPHCRNINVPRHNNHLHIKGFDVGHVKTIL